jgi:hypothetical protein
MLATCDPVMLDLHAADRGITRYAGELDENFRVRIANYPEVLRLGGTDAGVLLAVSTLGYEDPRIIPAKTFTGDENRWAEFYIVIRMDMDAVLPISTRILKQQVRKVKEVGAKDNYCFIYQERIKEQHSGGLKSCKYRMRIFYFPCRLFDGTWLFDGSIRFDSRRKEYPLRVSYRARIPESERIRNARIHEEHNLGFFDGTWKFDGSRNFDAWQKTEEL